MGNIKLYGRGDCADILDIGKGKVLKAFRRRKYSQNEIKDWSDHDAVVQAHFRAEKRTYERLKTSLILRNYVPKYYGSLDPHELNDNVQDFTTIYVKGCGIVLELVLGDAIKIRHLDSGNIKKVESILGEIRDETDSPNVWDSSCFIPGSRAAFTLIDFSTWGGNPYEDELCSKGVLTNTMRKALESEFSL